MSHLLEFAVHNTAVALALAICVYCVTRVWRNPPVAHALWLIVLARLVAPPVIAAHCPALRLPGPPPFVQGPAATEVPGTEAQKAEDSARFAARPTVPVTVPATQTIVEQQVDFAGGTHLIWSLGAPWLPWIWLHLIWLTGAAVCALVAGWRIVRFEQLLRDTLPVSGRLQRLTREIAGKLGIKRAPDVRYAEGVTIPMLWYAGRRPTIILPMRMMNQSAARPDSRLAEERAALILAHELAHLRRRDHFVRVAELLISVVYWWNPLVWLVRRQIHEAEEVCCDAWVRWAFPDWTKRYAELLLETAESLTASQFASLPLPGSPLLCSLTLKARIEMILESRFAPRISTRLMFAVVLLALLVLPTFVETTRAQAGADANDDAQTPAAKAESPMTADFPHVVKFEQGATQFAKDDRITILSVSGTHDTFSTGNIYKITGTYTLASRDRAILLASITVIDTGATLFRLDPSVRGDYIIPGRTTRVAPGHATGIELKVQRQSVARGTGKFTLYLPMAHAGLPHVSFYAADNGEGFGGNYFGTGDSVLKKWWASDQSDRRAASPPARVPVPADADFSHAVKFEEGTTEFLKGDNISIVEIRGTADKFVPGNSYLIKGTYTLTSHNQATLAAYTTATDAENGSGESQPTQTTVVNKGSGTFTLVLPMSCRGYPHLSFYAGGGSVGGKYFGTGDSLLKP